MKKFIKTLFSTACIGLSSPAAMAESGNQAGTYNCTRVSYIGSGSAIMNTPEACLKWDKNVSDEVLASTRSRPDSSLIVSDQDANVVLRMQCKTTYTGINSTAHYVCQ